MIDVKYVLIKAIVSIRPVIEVADEDEGRMGPGDPTPTVAAGDEWITPAITPCWSKDD